MERVKNLDNREWKRRVVLIAFLDVVSIACSYFFALLVRFDFRFSEIEPAFIQGYLRALPVWCVVTLAMFFACRLYHSIWSQVSIREVEMIFRAYVFLVPCYVLAALLLKLNMPRSYYPIGFLLNFGATTLLRFSYRMARTLARNLRPQAETEVERIMVIGAGAAGQMLVKELQSTNHLNSKVCSS